MRIISGTVKGRKLFTPTTAKRGKSSIRPTSDKVRESIFNILGPKSVFDNVLDLYAGTGALGIEALSRGSGHCTFVDNSRKAIGLIRRNLEICGVKDRSAVYQRDIGRGLGFLKKINPNISYNLVLIDPPYHLGTTHVLLEKLQELCLVTCDGLVLVEDSSEVELPDNIGGFTLADSRSYGDTSIWIFQNI